MNTAVNDAAKLSLLINIAARAIDAEEARYARRCCQSDLNTAYQDWKDQNAVHRVERDSDDWNKMMAATAGEYEKLTEAKRVENNADKRLRTVVYRYKSIINAELVKSVGFAPFKDNGLHNANMLATLDE